jgi:octaprenyl-diphosphate synthase
VKSSGGMDYAIRTMKDYQQKALDILAEFPDNEAKES